MSGRSRAEIGAQPKDGSRCPGRFGADRLLQDDIDDSGHIVHRLVEFDVSRVGQAPSDFNGMRHGFFSISAPRATAERMR
jgi:hypothetical protein